MAVQKFGQKLLMNGNFAVPQRSQFLLVVVDQDDVVTEIGETSACDQSYISRTDDSNPHVFAP